MFKYLISMPKFFWLLCYLATESFFYEKQISLFGYKLYHVEWDRIMAYGLFKNENWAGYDLSLGVLLTVATFLLLWVEINSSSDASDKSINNHIWSVFVMIGFIVLIAFRYQYIDISCNVILAVASFVDVVAGFSNTIRSGRKDITLG